MAKVPTELYICVPRRSAKGTSFYTNIWANLARKDTGEGIGGKWLYSYLDGVNISSLRTIAGSGYAPDAFDINPKTEGLHKTWAEFLGDDEFEPCKSEEITLKADPNLGSIFVRKIITSISGIVPFTIQVSGRVYIGYVSGKYVPPEYSIPLDLMVYDTTNTKTLQPVKTVMSNPDGTYAIEYTFTKPGSYRVFVNFLGDDKYRSDWSNNGATTKITVTGGELPVSFEKAMSVTKQLSLNFKWILGDTEPTTPDGYERAPTMDFDFGTLGKYWAFVKQSP